MISEIVNLVNKGEVSYDCNVLTNADAAVRYLIQRGLPSAALATAGTTNVNDYTMVLDPPATRYNDFMTLVIVPTATNTGPVRIDINTRGFIPVKRNDGLALAAGDMLAATPYIISYYAGIFYLGGIAKSQIPVLPDRTAIASGGPFDYTIVLNPPITAYEDLLTILIVPETNNAGSVRISINGLPFLPLRRNDGLDLLANDLRAGIPAIICLWSGSFYMVGLAPSQAVPALPTQLPVIVFGGAAAGGPNAYTVAIHPSVTAYSDYLTLVISPAVDNAAGGVNLNANNLGVIPLLRNDGQPLASKDLRQGRAHIVTYLAGNFFIAGLANSQVPPTAPITGFVDVWIRTDGNDANDGSANTAASAFATIQGAWNAVGGRYAVSPMFTVNLKLGVPGDYAMANLGPFGGTITLNGDANNKTAYRILAGVFQGASVCCLMLGNCAKVKLNGITLVLNRTDVLAGGTFMLWIEGSSCQSENCRYALEVSTAANPSAILRIQGGGSYVASGTNDFVGNGNTILTGIYVYRGEFGGSYPGANSPWNWSNIAFSYNACIVANGSYCAFGNLVITDTGCSGREYDVNTNGILYRMGQNLVGNQAGIKSTGGQVM